jgi:hypothetical protein
MSRSGLFLVAAFQPFAQIRGAPEETDIPAKLEMRQAVLSGALLANPRRRDAPAFREYLAVYYLELR